ncbi:MAG TPA: hypothetical protein VGK29_10825 [Paludibaculum sp.]
MRQVIENWRGQKRRGVWPGRCSWWVAVLAVIAGVPPSGAPAEMARNMAVGHAVFVGMFAGAG